ncbi:MAG: hypothetical protein Q4E53_07355 [Eubacteriales bacterium]|nr:hypothetical protein [Eubacteriales bacterium]
MNKMIRADFSRISSRVPRYIILLLIFAAEAATIYFATGGSFGDKRYYELSFTLFCSATQFFIGLIEMAYIFGDDLKAKVMQLGIGVGVNRRKIVFAKWFEIVILIAIDMAVMVGIAYAIGTIRQIPVNTFIMGFTKDAIRNWISFVVFISISMIFIFAFQSLAIGYVIFTIFNFDIINIAVSVLANMKLLKWLHLDQYTVTALVGHLKSVKSIALLAAYVIVSFIITFIVYGSKELEF